MKKIEKKGENILLVKGKFLAAVVCSAKHPPWLRCSTRPAPKNLNETHTSKQANFGDTYSTHLRMSEDKACGKQVSKYTDNHPEGSSVTSRETTVPENEEHSSGRTIKKSICLKGMSDVKQTGGKVETEKRKQPASQKKRTHTTRQVNDDEIIVVDL
jgi:hypothetical protein